MASCTPKLSVLLLLIIVLQKSCVIRSEEILLAKTVFVAERREAPRVDNDDSIQLAGNKEQKTAEPIGSGALLSEQANESDAANHGHASLIERQEVSPSPSLPLSADDAERLAFQLSQFDDRLEDDGLQSSSISAASLFDDSASSPGNSPNSLADQPNELQSNDTLLKRGLSVPISELNYEFLSFFDEMWRLKNNSIRALARLEYLNQSLFPLKTDKNRAIINRNNFSRTPPNRQFFRQHNSILNKNLVPSGTFQFKINKTSLSKRFPTMTTTTAAGNNYNLWRLNNMNSKRQMRNFTGTQQSQQPKPFAPFGSDFTRFGGSNNTNNNDSGSSTVRGRVNSLLLELNQKINNAVNALTSPLISKFSSTVGGLPASKPAAFSSAHVNDAGADDDERIPGGSRFRRSLPLSAEDPVERQARDENGSSGSSYAPAPTTIPSAVTSAAQRSADGRRTRPVMCAELDSSLLNKCKSSETLLYSSLNTSLPGTLMAIEDNCRHISFLMTSCWPKHLQIQASNESMVAPDFPMPLSPERTNRPKNSKQPGGGGGSDAPPSCGTAPTIPEVVQVRINWMWVHLCMDKRFRHGYVENLKCLSFWNQRRAEAVCSNESGRLRAMLNAPDASVAIAQPKVGANNQPELNDTDQTPFTGMAQGNSLAASKATPIVAGGQPTANRQAVLAANSTGANGDGGGVTDINGELESKALCCMFDLYLRCVHRQAIRDCGHAEGQFVVNFISRIGTDDLKYMCNGEMRPSQRGSHVTASSQVTSRRRQQQNTIGATSTATTAANTAEQSIFIESNYCSDSRIYMAIYGPQANTAGGGGGSTRDRNHFTPTANTGSNGNLRPMTGGGIGNGGRTNNPGPIGASSGDGDGVNFDNSYSTSNYDSSAGNSYYESSPETSGASQTTERLPNFAKLRATPPSISHIIACLAVVASWALSRLLSMHHHLLLAAM